MKHIGLAVSWILVVAGVTLMAGGAYELFVSKHAQETADREWHSGTQVEQPVPEAVLGATARNKAKPGAYFDPFKPGETLAQLHLPRTNTTLYVVEGTDQKDLKKGPGHMVGSALPGVAGNCVIAGHRDTHFRPLEDAKQGDEVDLSTRYGNFRYTIKSLEVVSPTDVSLAPTGNAVLHLITCYPFRFVGHAPKRLVISATLNSTGTSPGELTAKRESKN